MWHAGVHAAAVADGLVRIGFEIASQVIWDKGLFAMSRGWYHWGHEPCWVVRRPGGSARLSSGTQSKPPRGDGRPAPSSSDSPRAM